MFMKSTASNFRKKLENWYFLYFPYTDIFILTGWSVLSYWRFIGLKVKNIHAHNLNSSPFLINSYSFQNWNLIMPTLVIYTELFRTLAFIQGCSTSLLKATDKIIEFSFFKLNVTRDLTPNARYIRRDVERRIDKNRFDR